MPLSHGRNRRTRKLFKRPFRGHGLQNTTTFLRTYKVGDYVTILCNASVQHGLPFRAFHGKVGRVWNVNQRAIGVMINKKVNNRILVKRFHQPRKAETIKGADIKFTTVAPLRYEELY
ncbi:Large ribosomal subunit protein eL21 [Entamoeba marina]